MHVENDLTAELYPHLLDFNYDDVPLIWIKDSPIKTLYETYLSFTLPLLEDFMIANVLEFMPHLTEPRLLQNAKAFCEQEKNHGNQHTLFNQRMHSHGIDTRDLQSDHAKFKAKTARLSLDERLQLTAFLEGVTAGFAYEIICKRFIKEEWHPQAKELYFWHCLEEYEHRCLAFVVYMEKVKIHKGNLILITSVIVPLLWSSIKFMFHNLKKHKLLWTKETLRDCFWFCGPHGPGFYMLKCYYRFFGGHYDPKHIYFNSTIQGHVLAWEEKYHNVKEQENIRV
jgi:predicted metal-dependent hydrolase